MQHLLNLLYTNRSTYRAVLAIVCLSSSISLADVVNQIDKSTNTLSSNAIATLKKHGDANPPLKRIKEEGGTVIIDGALTILEQTNVKTFDLVEISTPVTPATNHVRLFAVAIGTYTAIKALFDDGTIKVLINN